MNVMKFDFYPIFHTVIFVVVASIFCPCLLADDLALSKHAFVKQGTLFIDTSPVSLAGKELPQVELADNAISKPKISAEIRSYLSLVLSVLEKSNAQTAYLENSSGTLFTEFGVEAPKSLDSLSFSILAALVVYGQDIEEIHVSDFDNIDDNLIGRLMNLPNLKRMNIKGLKNISKDGIIKGLSSSKITRLIIVNCGNISTSDFGNKEGENSRVIVFSPKSK